MTTQLTACRCCYCCCCFRDTIETLLRFYKFRMCTMREYKSLILKCCCFSLSVLFFFFCTAHLKRWPLFCSSTRAFIAWMHQSSIRPTHSVCALFRCRRRCWCWCCWCWCWYGNFIVRIQCSVLNSAIMLCFYFYSSHLFAKISMCDKMWKKNADASQFVRFIYILVTYQTCTHTHIHPYIYWLIST